MNTFEAYEIAVPLLVALWIARELWGLFLRRSASAAPDETTAATTPTPDAPRTLPLRPVDGTDYIVSLGIALGFYLLALWRLGVPDQQYFDEIYHARSGMEYALRLDAHEWTHPPLAKILIGASQMMWRGSFDPRDGAWTPDLHYTAHQAFAWRYPSVLLGCGALLALYFLARTLFRSRPVAVAATLLLACDGVFFVQSRMAMTNTFTVFFALLAANGTVRFIRTGDGEDGRPDYRWLWLTGLGLALAIATRWTTLWFWGLNGLVLLWHLATTLVPRWRAAAARGDSADAAGIVGPLLKWAALVIVTMFGVPLAVYILSYIPYVLQGPGAWHERLFTLDATQHGWKRAAQLQRDMWTYHAGIKEKHPYSSPWWSWPLLLRPTWYYFHRDADGLVQGIWAIGNAAVWWASVPALLTAATLAWREKRAELGLIAFFGLGQWALWAIQPRGLIFLHYYYETIPFACLALAYLVCRLWYSGDETRRTVASCYAVLALAWFLFYYPLLSALPITERYYQMHLWLGKPWI